MNIFPEKTNKVLKNIAYVIITISVMYSISNGIIHALLNGLIWWFVFWVLAKFLQKSENKNNEISDIKPEKKLIKLKPNDFIKKEGILSVNDFFEEAKLNLVRAKQKFIRKPLKIQGIVRDIYEDGNFVTGYAIYIVLSDISDTGEDFNRYIAKFSLDRRKSISSLNIGDHIVISGFIQGFENEKINMHSSYIVQ